MVLKSVVLLVAVFSCVSVCAQDSSAPKKITIKGFAKTQTIDCNGERVFIMDDYNKINITGHCSQILVYGNKCVINLESVSIISLHGDDNKITYKADPQYKTKVSRYGNYNRVTKIE